MSLPCPSWAPLRLSAWFGANNHPQRKPGRPGEELTDFGAIDLKKGGTAIPYHEEDPYVRAEFEAALKAEGVPSRMDAKLFQTPDGYPK